MALRELVANKREDISALAAQHRAKRVRLFGSAVRGEETPESDVDFLVEFEDGASLFDHVGLMQGLEDLLGRKVDVVSDHPDLHRLIRREAEREAVRL